MSLSVLVVEDSRTQLVRLRADLGSQGFRVTTAQDGADGLAVARRDAPDIILSDVLMPGMDGFRLCREVQLDPSLRHIPVVLRTTAFVSNEDRDFALGLGAREYIEKEIAPTELADLLKRIAGDTTTEADGGIGPEDFHGDYEQRLLSRLVEEAAHLEKVNEELRESRGRLQAILDHTPAYIYVKDLEGKYVVTNGYFSTLGADPEALIGRNPEDFFDPEFAQDWLANDRRVAEQRRAIYVEEQTPVADDVHTMLSAKFPLLNAEGELTAVSGVSIDITERKRMEQRLRQAGRMEALGRLSGGIAHDFNNLLTIISSYASFVAEDLAETDPRREDLEQVQGAATRGANLVRQLLAFAGRKDTADAVELDLNSVIRGMESLLRVSAGSRVELTLDLDPEVPLVAVDPTTIDQIILNLVGNARDAMPEGGSLDLRTKSATLRTDTSVGDSDLPAGLYATLTVEDTGMGMSTETLERIFEPFFTRKQQGKGTGLGLATVHGIVHSLGGAIAVRSQMAKGSTFTIWLPAMTADSDEEEGRGERLREVRGMPTVLVVDDEEGIREIVRRTLQRSGYAVVTASSGEEALRICEERPDGIDLVLSDIRMGGGMSGIELVQRLKSTAPGVPVLHMSGSEASATTSGLLKPFGAEDLLRAVEDAMRRPTSLADAD